ncbi:hypothetical protein SODALDRAFT_363701 [Sodiomyces alkalinus F11]|uniref:Uncharacterized protein n=1 Tax=Sodiomyces alkalinus (strain CBS 110278 / VKM F-3762 / F11) TaxID=1314773 RepID=A0A3N2PKF3_SODAK|nr:hypothetical protein SODALDRAFT_363701 [Sodiomyces alkalinus F11]ROT35008.1 hypothetical protein SODALDRAFT_363701 [Sodiomyces alkalinus F11]
MLRRPPTTLTITSEDVAAYEDRRTRQARQEEDEAAQRERMAQRTRRHQEQQQQRQQQQQQQQQQQLQQQQLHIDDRQPRQPHRQRPPHQPTNPLHQQQPQHLSPAEVQARSSLMQRLQAARGMAGRLPPQGTQQPQPQPQQQDEYTEQDTEMLLGTSSDEEEAQDSMLGGVGADASAWRRTRLARAAAAGAGAAGAGASAGGGGGGGLTGLNGDGGNGSGSGRAGRGQNQGLQLTPTPMGDVAGGAERGVRTREERIGLVKSGGPSFLGLSDPHRTADRTGAGLTPTSLRLHSRFGIPRWLNKGASRSQLISQTWAEHILKDRPLIAVTTNHAELPHEGPGYYATLSSGLSPLEATDTSQIPHHDHHCKHHPIPFCSETDFPVPSKNGIEAESPKMCMQIYRYYQECGCQLKHVFWPCEDGPASRGCHHVQPGVVVKPDAFCPYHERVEANRPENRPDTLSRRTNPRRRLFQVNWNTYMKTFHIPPHPRDKFESSPDSPWLDSDGSRNDGDDDDNSAGEGEGSEASESADWCYNWEDRIPWTYAEGGGPKWGLEYDTGYESGVEETDKQRRLRLQLKKRIIKKRIMLSRGKKTAK